ncbi:MULTISPECIES: glycosyltransferase [Kitasatospora]|uniref:Putative glycosyltransferase n=1 Tax=Kitasatospora setae (strain ATCC 33774 / DSM 43861 / JCM 3304 / KCC A-0304 / NBRC 14216 / KM-6054) TaxID=452652 RepID=E4N8D8_KITSK|nr:glycosyltransferase [Kitasatospora setae]BAJ27469.1 putative glycosyltransferase [Kitasatospora setae KM-6054]
MSGGRVKVLWLAKGLGRGGAEQLLLNCVRHADRSRYDIEVAYVLPHKDALVPALAAAGVEAHCLGGAPGWRWPLRLRALLAERRYDLVHTHMPVPAVAARLLTAGRGGARLVHTEHNLWERYRRPTRWANALTYRRNDAVIAVSHAVAAGVSRRRAGEWLSVVHHGPDLDGAPSGPAARRAARAELGLPPDALVVGSVGNLTAKKDQATMLAAFARLREREPDARLVLVGSGPLEAELRARAGEGVLFAGTRADVPALLPGWDVFCLSSRQEGLPVALMEAMTSGLPSVVTRVGGMPEVLDDGVQGRLVPPGDPAALAAALGELADPGLRERMGAAARERSRSFDVAGAQRAIERVYARVLADANRPAN